MDNKSFVGPASLSYRSTEMIRRDEEGGHAVASSAIGASEVASRDGAPLLQRDLLRSLSGLTSMLGFSSSSSTAGLSTFSGVFCPVALSMFSVMLFLRIGFVIGQAGILITLAQLTLAYGIILFTVLSLCAISTNGAIEGGGVYYMISRALGPEFGGSIGVLFFFANIFSCSLYISAFTEALMNNFGPGGYVVDGALPTGRWYAFLYGSCVSVILLLICLVGAQMFARTSLIVLFIVITSYVSFLLSLLISDHSIPIRLPADNPYGKTDENGTLVSNVTVYANYTGVRGYTFDENLYPAWAVDYTTNIRMDFALVFAVVFSGITGLMAGANMSGELKQPNLSIPRGTLQALLVTFIVYALTTFLLGASCSRVLLQNNYIVMQTINIWPPFIFVGIVAATVAAAMSNLIGASRVLFRLAVDRLFGNLLHVASYTGKGNNPIIAVLISWSLVLAFLLIGAFNVIAQITSVFFLLSYAAVNLACLALDLTSAPNFRPTFRCFSAHTSLLGFAGCVAMMFVINPASSGITIVLVLLLLIGLHYAGPMPASWGSISQALIFHQVRKYLLMLDPRKEHVKFWRPQILLLVASPKSCLPLIDFVNDLKKSGLYVLGHVEVVEEVDWQLDPVQKHMPYWLGLIDYLKIKAFVELTVAKTVNDGAEHLIRLSGIGAMKPNTIIMGFYDSTPSENLFDKGRLLRNIKFAKLERAEVVEYFTIDDPPDRIAHSLVPGDEQPARSERSFTAQNYIRLVNDVLRMNKNIVLARHFQLLDKENLLRSSGYKCVDVWPVDLVRPENASVTWDNSSLFLLQLACILSMSGGWKNRIMLRVFLCVRSVQDIQRKEFQLKEMLGQLRILAKSIILPWDHVICHVTSDTMQSANDLNDMPMGYLKSFNELMLRNSGQSALVFLSLPPPPVDLSKAVKYLQRVECLTDGLPPTLLIYGISSVISTAL